VLAATAIGAALAMTACSGGETPQTDPTDLRGQTIRIMVSSGHQQFNPIWDTELAKWEEDTGIKVEVQKVDTTEILSTFLKDAQLGSCTFDNVEMLDGGSAASAPYMADLGPLLEESGTSVDELASEQVGWAVKSMTFDGKLKFYPFYSGAKGVAFRKDLFEDPANQAAFKAEYGYDLPEQPTEPQQVVDLAEFFTKDGMKGIVFSGAGDPAATGVSDVMFRNGVAGFQDEDGNALFGPEHPDNQKKAVEAAEWLTNFITKGYTPDTLKAMQTTDATAAYLAGDAAMLYDHIYLSWSQLTDPANTASIGESGSFEMPSLTEGQGGIPFYWGRGIPECSQHKAASWEFMKWIMSPEIQELALSEGTGVYVPTDTELLDWGVEQGIFPQGVADSVTHAQYYRITTITNQLRQTIGIPAAEKLIGGQSPEDFVTESGQEMQQAAEDAGVVG